VTTLVIVSLMVGKVDGVTVMKIVVGTGSGHVSVPGISPSTVLPPFTGGVCGEALKVRGGPSPSSIPPDSVNGLVLPVLSEVVIA
jgi:hypothetical protein